MNKLSKKFFIALILFGLTGQVAWTVENMYLNVFLYKMFHATPTDISLMVSASAITATLTTILMGALSDRVGKRKIFICMGYLLWGITILGFGFIRRDILSSFCASMAETLALGISLTIVLDCIMTFLGSTANDAAYNAWLTDVGDETNRGKIEGVNAMMPLIGILVVFGGFMGLNLDEPQSWTTIYFVIGVVVLLLGALGFFLIDEVPVRSDEPQENTSFFHNLTYSFRISTLRENRFLYAIIGVFALFGISIQVFMPYLILYYEQTLKMENYIMVLAPAIVLAAVITVFYGRLYDMLGFQKSIIPSIGMLVAGYVMLYFSVRIIPVFVGSLLMMCGYLTGMAVFGAVIRERIPERMAGRFQGIRIIGQVLIPGVIGPVIGAFVLRDANQIVNGDGTFSFIPDKGIWVAALVMAVVVCVALYGVFVMMRQGHFDLLTVAAEEDTEKDGWKDYPRPQLKREGWMILREGWKLNGADIRVPFPPESILSEYSGRIGTGLVYEKEFDVPASFTKERILLHFGAVDQIAKVWVNGKEAGFHEGGYLPFSLDITDLVHWKEKNSLVVKVKDSLSKVYPYGKQRKKRGGMWYTPISGIWQSVWLENVGRKYVKNIVLKPDLNGVQIHLESEGDISEFVARVVLDNGKKLEQTIKGTKGYIRLTGHVCEDGSNYMPKLWTPKQPYLYEMTITTECDEVTTYFALRTIEIQKINGIQRVCLNGKPIFLHGVLDQGYFSDGIFLPVREEEYEKDILRMKELGFNMLRKHIKVEPECFYYYCDKHGMMVMQDMINNGSYSFLRDTALPTIGMRKKKDTHGRANERKRIFKEHSEQTIRHLYNHPCIVAYTIFNEGWGQFDSDAMYDFVKELDDSRLIDSTSGWFWQEKSDFDSVHIYFKTIKLAVKDRPLLVSECGGYSRVVAGHYYSRYNSYGYGGASDETELTKMIVKMYKKMILPEISAGACGCVYTQLSDVEDEMNGLYTYDRKVCKVEKDAMLKVAEEIEAIISK